MKPGDMVETPRGLLARIVAIRGNRADLRYICNGVGGSRKGLPGDRADVTLPLEMLRGVTKGDKTLAVVVRQ